VTDDAPLMIYSSDTHVGPRPEDLRPYCPKKFLPDFDTFASTVVEQYRRSIEDRPFSDDYQRARRQNAKTAGHHDPHARLRDMDRDGVTGGVIFHDSLNGQPFPLDWNGRGKLAPEPEARELAAAGRALYNRWLADFCSVEPDRSVGLAQLPFWDIEAAIDELEWAADNGLRGVTFPAPGTPGFVQPSHVDMDRFFAACASLEMTLTTHIGAMPPVSGYGDPADSVSFASSFGLVDIGEWGKRTVYLLVMLGVFERHPNLKLVLTEVPGVFWEDMCLKMDSVYSTPIQRPAKGRPPSEYAATNVWMGNSFMSRGEATDAIEIGREDRFLWGSDYPHPEGTFIHADDPDEYPRTRLALANTFHGLPLEKVRRMLGANCVDAYPRLDPAALDEVAKRVGVPVDEIDRAPDLSQHRWITDAGTLAFRTSGPWS
jgi:predicted TIM-barrel fold metal-dependent hydrolase